MPIQRHYVFLGLSITSTWGNGHATTYRGLLKELSNRGNKVTFLERDVPWYARNREFDHQPYCSINLYSTLDELKDRFSSVIAKADAVVVGSYVPEGVAVGRWVTCTAKHVTSFYDIDTPVTLAKLRDGTCEYLSYDLIRKYQLYLSFTGGPTLEFIERRLGSPCAFPLYCSVDAKLYRPESVDKRWDIGYLGTYAPDRQSKLDRLLLGVARQSTSKSFAVAGPQYPESIQWPANVEHIYHLPAMDHRRFYNSQRFTLNLTRRDMVQAGYSPSVRLFEAAACGIPILTDEWPGLDRFFQPHSEILPVATTADVISYLKMPDERRKQIGENARRRTLRFHTAAVRAQEFERYVTASLDRLACSKKKSQVVMHTSSTAAVI
jgi:spore maturation protein CgeB